ncbi:MAG: tRNA (adenosine(37)-N6)-threonylcarbamoyltransferase complex dimerization subunit type 1 TsaB [Candidatus Cloacimonetes bacterium]|nr:tRNA (adenosine(37)-N6)-threonylcarbamoyltransferase complex dimerization subunit type 1 TsaB [Candidatus Cloacimonadota bacterium]
MNILALNTSSTSGSIAISKDGIIVFISYLDIKVTHSERLLPQIDYALKHCKLTIDDIDLICFANGPGSFTGIRIGLSTVKGICMVKEIPLMPVSSLELLAYNVFGVERDILCFVDARMSEVYAALYSPNMKEIISPCSSKPDKIIEKIDSSIIIVGDGKLKYKEFFEKSKLNYINALPHQDIGLASNLISIALLKEKLPEYDFDEISNLEPYYLRKSQAEIMKEQASK